jgi:hypothetical protein
MASLPVDAFNLEEIAAQSPTVGPSPGQPWVNRETTRYLEEVAAISARCSTLRHLMFLKFLLGRFSFNSQTIHHIKIVQWHHACAHPSFF